MRQHWISPTCSPFDVTLACMYMYNMFAVYYDVVYVALLLLLDGIVGPGLLVG